jgi:hypothetical protein
MKGIESNQEAKLRILNADAKYSKVKLIEPTSLGYIYIAAAVQPSPIPLVLPSAKRARLLARLHEMVKEIEQLNEVIEATVFRTVVVPPTSLFNPYLKERRFAIHIPDFDLALLVQTKSPEAARNLPTTASYAAVMETIRAHAKSVFVMAARNARRIADVDTTRNGLFLFNHFAADDPLMMQELWEYLADWYVKETGLENSVALVPLEGERSDYAIVNWARWDVSPQRHFWHQLAKKSFWQYVNTNLVVNRAGSMPVYLRLA